ncbi:MULTISPECIES: hypothetical protein [Pseudomonas]|jgi:hypothetical protein|uniref:hypothetical protein n=1 Tax=Pseudomonas TaxID=286 RepID=UPI000AF1A3AC|nr:MULTISPECIES: hypothetical protein [Pseudomonas]
MHPSFQERSDDLGVPLHQTSAVRVGDFARIGRPAPAKPVRYQISGGSFGMYQIKDLTTGKTCAFSGAYKAAHELAMQFEAKANRQVAVTL